MGSRKAIVATIRFARPNLRRLRAGESAIFSFWRRVSQGRYVAKRIDYSEDKDQLAQLNVMSEYAAASMQEGPQRSKVTSLLNSTIPILQDGDESAIDFRAACALDIVTQRHPLVIDWKKRTPGLHRDRRYEITLRRLRGAASAEYDGGNISAGALRRRWPH